MSQGESIDRDRVPSDYGQAELETSVADLLSRMPERWAVFSPDDLSVQEATALAHLAAAEMVERRCRFRLRMLNQPLAVEATITATGEYGLVEALETLAASMWEDWRGAFATWHASDTRDSTPVHGELLEPQEWRLTTSGVQARGDLSAGRRREVFDFVLRRWPLTFRPPVRGHGRLLRISRPDAKAPPTPIAVANWSEGAAAFVEAFSQLTESLQSQGQSPSAAGATPTPKTASRCEGRNLDTEVRLKRFLSDRAARYEQLVEAVLRGETDARRVFQDQFGPIGDPPGALPLYRLPEIATATRVFVTEGEKAADAAHSIGLVATTSAHGAKSPHKTDWSPLAGKDVVILPDNDAPGREYAAQVRQLLSEVSPPARTLILELPGLAEQGDGLAAEERAERPGPQADDLRDATTFLQDALAGGPRLTKDVEDEGHQAHGLTRRTLQRARKNLGIESFREEVPGPWWLRLPSNTAKAAKEEELGALGTVAKTAEF